MKKIISMIIATIFLASCSSPHVTSLETPDNAYELDTFMANSEIYEFTPKWAPNKLCVVYILDNLKSSSMQCFDKTVVPKKIK